MTYDQPPMSRTAEGKPRHVGIEIEFAGLEGPEAAQIVSALMGGSITEEDPHRFKVEGSDLGDVTLELDTQYVHASNDAESKLVEGARKALGDIAQIVVPYELITEPLTFDQLPKLDAVTEALRDAGAKGTSQNPVYAFGLHLNPEAGSLEPDYLVSILGAFALLNEEIRKEIRPDASRNLMGWAARHDDDFVRKLLTPGYEPTLDELIRDYVEANPGRNYDLDMLPLFAEAAPDLMKELVGDMLSKPRPAFHYRLPDCRIDETGWTVATDWNRWVRVERLAADKEQLARLAARYLDGESADSA